MSTPRYFRPVGGFNDQNVVAIRFNDPNDPSWMERVFTDGRTELAGSTNHHNQHVPLYTLQEVMNLVASGSFEEIEEPAEMKKTEVPSETIEETEAKLRDTTSPDQPAVHAQHGPDEAGELREQPVQRDERADEESKPASGS